MKSIQLIRFAILLGVVGGRAFAQQPTVSEVDELKRQLEALQQAVAIIAEGQSATTTAEVTALREQLEALNQKVKILEREKEIEKEAAAEKAKSAVTVTANPKDGFGLKSADGAFSLKLNGRILYDVGWFDQESELFNAVGDEQDGTGFRSVRLRLSGTLFKDLYYQTEYDFAGQNGTDNAAFADTYIALRNIPYGGERAGELRVGHFREPFSLEQLTTLTALPFNERSLSGGAFNPVRNPGIQWSDSLIGPEKQERLYYAIGIFKNADNWPSSNDSDEDQGWNFGARVTGLPYYQYNGERLLHIGAAYNHSNPDGAIVNFRPRPENNLALFRYADTDAFQNFRLRDARADDIDRYNIELAGVWGPLSFQSEYTRADVETTFDGDRTFSGYYAGASYFLTGETRPYRHDTATFGQVVPKRNFGWGTGGSWGAWELGVRYSSVDLSDGGIHGGEQDSITGVLRWHLNPNTAVSLEYVHNNVENDLFDGSFDSLGLRTQITF